MNAAQNSTKKLRIVVLFGGKSGEHEVSLRSGASVMRLLDRARFEVIPVGIDKSGRWRLCPLTQLARPDGSIPESLEIPADAQLCALCPGEGGNLRVLDGAGASLSFDVVFPVVHGPLCEDGTLQGSLELADVAYVGCGVLASAAGMDKEISKRLAEGLGLPVVPYVTVRKGQWQKTPEIAHESVKKLGFPVFVKPANMGSSVGVHRVKDENSLPAALDDALRYDTKVLVEVAVEAREIEVAVLENPADGSDPLVSLPGEVVPAHEFYSYEAKYLDDHGAALVIPAKLSENEMKMAQDIAKKVFMALECEGLARCDLFIDKKTGQFFFNEINTMPGFTSISMYPKMWEATGISYPELLSKLVDLAVNRHHQKSTLLREFKA